MTFKKVPAREPGTGRVHVIIDTPAGSANKYKFDEEYGVFRVSRKLPEGMVFPYDFGSVPGTRAEDGDPLDVLVLGLTSTFPGCLITARLIGVLHAYQREKGRRIRNDRFIAAAETPVNTSIWRSLADLPDGQLNDIQHFFESYNAAQGRPFRISGHGNRRAAEQAVTRAVRTFAAAKRTDSR
jgi:inorganic pyrophosphatase